MVSEKKGENISNVPVIVLILVLVEDGLRVMRNAGIGLLFGVS